MEASAMTQLSSQVCRFSRADYFDSAIRRVLIIVNFVRCATSLWTDRPRCRPVGVSNPLQRHLEETDGILTRRDPFADLTQRAILDGCGVSNCHGTGRDLP